MSTFLVDEAPFFINDAAATASGSITVPGYTELDSGSASAFVLSGPPYVGAMVGIYQTGSATTGKTVITDTSAVTLNTQGDRTITFAAEGNFVVLLGISTTRWQMIASGGVTTA